MEHYFEQAVIILNKRPHCNGAREAFLQKKGLEQDHQADATRGDIPQTEAWHPKELDRLVISRVPDTIEEAEQFAREFAHSLRQHTRWTPSYLCGESAIEKSGKSICC